MIRCFHVAKRYGAITALRDINFQIDQGEFVFLTGQSGAGKTTLLRLLYRAELPTSGQLVVCWTQPRNYAKAPGTTFSASSWLGIPRFQANRRSSRV